MAAIDFRQIVVNYQFILDDLPWTDAITDHLFSYLALNQHDVDFIKNGGENTKKARVERLINALRQKGDDKHEGKSVWDRLVLVLEKTDNTIIADVIKNTDPDKVPYNEDGLYDLPATGDVSGGYEQIKDQSVREINAESRRFQSCPNYVKALDLVKNHRTLFITGSTSSRKTAIGTAILRHYRMRGWTPLVLDTYEQFRQHVDGNRRQVVFLDAIFEGDTEKDFKFWKRAITILTSQAEENKCYAVISIESKTLSVLEEKFDFESLFDTWSLLKLDLEVASSDAVSDAAFKTYMREAGKSHLHGMLQGITNEDFATNNFLNPVPPEAVDGLSQNIQHTDAQTKVQTALSITKNFISPLIQYLLQSLQSDTAVSGSHFVSPPLHLAAKSGDLQVVRFLLACHVDVNCRDQNGATALLHAVSARQIEITTLLLNAGAKADLTPNDGWGPLHFAASKGYDKILERLIQQNADLVFMATSHGDTALHLAATNSHVGIVRVLLENGAEPNAKDKKEKTPLHLASFHGHAELVTTLLDKGADIEAQDELKATPLHIAVQEGHVQIVQILLERGANTEHPANFKWSLLKQKVSADDTLKSKDIFEEDLLGVFVLHIACLIGNESIVSMLIDAGVNLEAVSESCTERPLHFACTMGHRNIVERLLGRDVDVKAESSSTIRPIHLACLGGDTEVLSLLLKAGEKIDITDNKLHTPLHHACLHGNADAARFLIQNGAQIDLKNKVEDTAFTLSCWKGHKSTAAMLKDLGADFKVTNNDNRSALHSASHSGHVEVVKWLIELGLSVEQKSIKGRTPLHEGALGGHNDVIQALLENGAVLDLRDNDGDTAFTLSCWKGHKSTAEMLKDLGADVQVTENDNRSELHGASRSGHVEKVQWLIQLGLSLEQKSIIGRTPLHEGALGGHNDVIQVLLENGAVLDLRDMDGNTAFILSCWQGHKSTAEMLKDFGADVKVTNKENRSALHLASRSGHVEAVKWLIQLGLSVQQKSIIGRTPIHEGAKGGHNDVIHVLLENGAVLDFDRYGCRYSFHTVL